MTQTLLIRTDGSSQIGTGHVMRCLTLAQAWHQTGGTVRFVGSDIPNGLRDRIDAWSQAIDFLDSSPGSQEDAARTAAIAVEHDVEWIVVDGPHFDADYLTELTSGDSRVLLIDDMGERSHYDADLVLNQNLHADPEMYTNRDPETELLLGPDYVLFRNEFLKWKDWSPDHTQAPETLLITLGGSDPDNATKTVIESLNHVTTELKTLVIIGAANDSYPDLVDLAEDINHPIRFEQNISNMASQMARADLAVSSGGTTCWELAYMGVPTIVGTLAPIEEQLVAGLKDFDLFSHIGDFKSATGPEIANLITHMINHSKYRTEMSLLGQKIIDGQGRQRTIKKMCEF